LPLIVMPLFVTVDTSDLDIVTTD